MLYYAVFAKYVVFHMNKPIVRRPIYYFEHQDEAELCRESILETYPSADVEIGQVHAEKRG